MSSARRTVLTVVSALVVLGSPAVLLGAAGSGPPLPPSGASQGISRGAAEASAPSLRAAFGQAADASPPTVYAGPEGRVLLGPKWSYRADPQDAGLARGWQHGRFEARRISVPHSPNARPTTGAAGFRNYEGGIGWYRRAFRVERSGRYAIRFESVHHRATVWVNGRAVGQHVGAYRPWEVRPVLRRGRSYRLVVRADWRFPLEQKRAAWHRGWFNYGGLHREVSIRRLGASELEAPNLQTRLSPTGLANVSMAVRVHNRERARSIPVAGTLTAPDGRAIPVPFASRSVASGAREVFRATVEVPAPALWSTADPALYELRLEVPGEAAYRARVGLRELRWANGRVYLNGRALFLHGASVHEDVRGRGDALRAEDQDRLVARLKTVGANATRAQHPLHPALMERFDAAGILVWQEIGPWDSPGQWMSRTAALRRQGVARVQESLEQLQLHPSVFTWNLGNEVARNGHPGQVVYVNRAARLLHRQDPGRPVALDIWGILLPRRAGPLYRRIDAIGATNYIGWYEWTFAREPEIRRRIRARLAYLRKVFPDKVIVATEFGAEGNARNRSAWHGGFGYQAKLLRINLETYRRAPDASGMILWNLQDFGVNPAFGGGSILRKVRGIRLIGGLNQKGLFDSRGRPKPSVPVVREQFRLAKQERGA